MKAIWKNIYSKLGFWTYMFAEGNNVYKVVYWGFSFGKFYKNFDLFKIKMKYEYDYDDEELDISDYIKQHYM